MATIDPPPSPSPARPRLRQLGLAPGILPCGPLNAITDVAGVRVGHVTQIEGDDVRTGATAILPHGGNLYQDKAPAAFVAGNGYGKLAGGTQIVEMGEIETPIVLTNTLAVAAAMDAILDWMLAMPGNEAVLSANAVVGETNDGSSGLNDIRRRLPTTETIKAAIEHAAGGPVAEGAVGAGTGTAAFGWKAGIGTSSRRLLGALDGQTVGVLVQSNFGGVLQMLGAPVGMELGQYYGKKYREQQPDRRSEVDGSIMIVVATDLPLSDRNLTRLAWRALAGLARTGSSLGNGSGDYVIAFSTAETVRRTPERRSRIHAYPDVPNDAMSQPFQAVIEATEEAILNSLLRADTMRGFRKTVQALPLAETVAILARYGYAGKVVPRK